MEPGAPLVVKTGGSGGDFAIEAFMLRHLAKNTYLPALKFIIPIKPYSSWTGSTAAIR